MKKKMKKKHCDLNFWSIDSPTRKGGPVDMVLVVFILIIDARQAATLPPGRYWILLFAVFLSRKIGKKQFLGGQRPPDNL